MQLVSKEGGASYFEAPKVPMPQWSDTISTNTTIHHSTNTATADACIQDFCTVLLFSYAISANHNSTGRVYRQKLCYNVYRTVGNSSLPQTNRCRRCTAFHHSPSQMAYKNFILVNAKLHAIAILFWFSVLLFSLGE